MRRSATERERRGRLKRGAREKERKSETDGRTDERTAGRKGEDERG